MKIIEHTHASEFQNTQTYMQTGNSCPMYIESEQGPCVDVFMCEYACMRVCMNVCVCVCVCVYVCVRMCINYIYCLQAFTLAGSTRHMRKSTAHQRAMELVECEASVPLSSF